MSRFQVNGVDIWNYVVKNACRAVIIAGVPGTVILKGTVLQNRSGVSGILMKSTRKSRRAAVIVTTLNALG